MQPEEPGIQQAFSPGFFQPQEVSASGCECATFTRNVKVKVSQSCLTLSPHELYSPWNSPGQNTGMGSHSLLQGIFPGIKPECPAVQQILSCLSHQGNLWMYTYIQNLRSVLGTVYASMWLPSPKKFFWSLVAIIIPAACLISRSLERGRSKGQII